MKKIYTFLLSLLILITMSINSNSQSLSVSGSLFLPQDMISFTYSDPAFSSTDWIGIYKTDELPGGPAASSWDYVTATSGTLDLQAPMNAGTYKAFLLCCDGYDIIATSAEFTIEEPSLTSSFPSYVQGDSMVFSYVSPKFSATDWIGIYPAGTKPSLENPSIDWGYITSSQGTKSFKTALNPGFYDVYLVCCDGYDSISACTIEVIDANIASVKPISLNFEAGSTLKFTYNDPDFVDGDWIAIYFEYDDPTLVSSVTWSKLVSKSGVVSFPGVLAGGDYIAVLFCCGSTETEYARSEAFHVSEGAVGTYVKTAAGVYPEGVNILVNFRDNDFTSTDWIGIYNENDVPGGPQSIEFEYVPGDSGTIEFSPLSLGNYTVYLLCCDAYNIKAQYDFKVVDYSTPSLVASKILYANGEGLEFTFNSPDFTATDWIGIYNAGEIPGGEGIYSIWWEYLPETNGIMPFIFPDDYGQNTTDISLPPGDYLAGLFCCDAYGLYASVTFSIGEFGLGVKPELNPSRSLSLYPNPGNGIVNVKVSKSEKIQNIIVYTIAGQVVFRDKQDGSLSEKTIDLKLSKGIYFLEVQTENSKQTKKVIIQ